MDFKCDELILGKTDADSRALTVIRADEVDANGEMEPIVIGANSNIQDGVVIHSKSGAAVTIGEFSSIRHSAANSRI